MSPGRSIPRAERGPVGAALLSLIVLFGASGSGSALAASPPGSASHAVATKAQEPSAPRAPAASDATGDVDVSSRNVVARARMLECGHQWSNMKRAGTATGTWKDFSRGCLAQR